jgi:hypothetical protein
VTICDWLVAGSSPKDMTAATLQMTLFIMNLRPMIDVIEKLPESTFRALYRIIFS